MEIYPWAWFYFVSFVLFGTFIVMNLIVGVIVTNLDKANAADEPVNASEKPVSANEAPSKIAESSRDQAELAALRADIAELKELITELSKKTG